MTVKKLSLKTLVYEAIILLIMIAISWLNEVIDIPYLFFNSPKTPINVTECVIETFIFLIFGILIIGVTCALLKKIINIEKSRQDMERIFFHDVFNIASNIHLCTQLLSEKKANIEKIKNSLSQSLKNLLEEIEAQRNSIVTEDSKLNVKLSPINSKDFLLSLSEIYKIYQIAQGKQILVSENSCNIEFLSDKILLEKILSNLIKNALEASNSGQIITFGCWTDNINIFFWCRNEAYIPKKIQKTLFKKWHSTKGIKRGLGTYSLKLLTEKYLNGVVSFVSTPKEGTTFTISLPLK